MITKQLGRLTLKMYNGIDELPAERYHKFNLYCLMSAGIGNDAEALQSHMASIYTALNKKDYDSLLVMFQNYYHSLHFIVEQMDTQSIAFCCLIHSINGDEITDISDDNLMAISKRINKATKRSIALKLLDEIKKKLNPKSRYISPVELAEQKQKRIMASLNDVRI